MNYANEHGHDIWIMEPIYLLLPRRVSDGSSRNLILLLSVELFTSITSLGIYTIYTELVESSTSLYSTDCAACASVLARRRLARCDAPVALAHVVALQPARLLASLGGVIAPVRGFPV